MTNKLTTFLLRKCTDPESDLYLEKVGYCVSLPFGEYTLYIKDHKERGLTYENQDYVLFIEGFFLEDESCFWKMISGIDVRTTDVLTRTLKELNGYYSGVLKIKKSNITILFSDKFGIRRIYYDESLNSFSNNEFELVKHTGFKIDEMAIREKIVLDYPIDNRTYFSNIKVVLPLRIVVIRDGVLNQVFYRIDVKRSGSIEEVKKAYERLFERLSLSNINLGLGLSKGKDSRMYLYFLNQFRMNYKIFTFQLTEGDMEYKDCLKIAKRLDMNLMMVPMYRPSDREIIGSSKDAILSHEFDRLGRFARENGVDALLIGYLGDHISGKLSCFRNFGIKDLKKLVDQLFLEYTEGLKKKDLETFCSRLSGTYDLVYENWLRTFDDFEYLSQADAEILHYLEVRGFRRILPRLLQIANHVDVVFPNTENGVFYSYLSLPQRLIKSQEAHTYLASLDKSAGAAKSTAFPISLRNEVHFRTLIRYMVLTMNLFKRYESAKQIETLALDSETLRNFFRQKEVKGNGVICRRLRQLDAYLRYVENNFSESY